MFIQCSYKSLAGMLFTDIALHRITQYLVQYSLYREHASQAEVYFLSPEHRPSPLPILQYV
jgi:hypothetical protein